MRRLLFGALTALLVVGSALAGEFFENAGNTVSGLSSTIVLRDRQVSAANTALTVVYDIANISNILVATAACSAGTATLTISGSSDDANFLTIDSLVAAATNTKQYNNSSTGASLAVTPLAFRWLKISVGSCGASNTSTLTVAGK